MTAGKFVSESRHLLKDCAGEAKYGFKLKDALKSPRGKLFDGALLIYVRCFSRTHTHSKSILQIWNSSSPKASVHRSLF